MRARSLVAAVATAAAMTGGVALAAPAQADAQSSATLATLATLPVKGRAPKTGYDRSLFGDSWTDDVTVTDGHNGCDTRNDILRRDLVAVEIKPGSNGCAVLSGTSWDPYTGTTIDFQRGDGTSSQVQIDHVVAFSDAWQKGAQQWDAATLRNFANDPINLQATSASINQQKGDGDAATWLPPNKSYRCTYVSRIVDVKSIYGLWVTQAEHDAIAAILTGAIRPLLLRARPTRPAPLALTRKPPGHRRIRSSQQPPSTLHRMFPRPPRLQRQRWLHRCTTPTTRRQDEPVQPRCTPGSPVTGLGLTATAMASPASHN